MKIITFLAVKDIARDKKIAMLVVFLLAFSYINLTFFPAFLNGLSNTFQEEVVDTATSHIIITPRPESGQLYLGFESSIRKKIDLVPGVTGSSSHISTTGTVFFKDKQAGAPVTALTPSDDAQVTVISQKIRKGEFLADTDRDSIVLGELIAGRKIEDRIGKNIAFGVSIEGLGGVEPGERVRIRFANGVEREYRIKGIVGSDGFSFVSQSVYINRKEIEDVLGINDQASSILVRLNDRNDADFYKNLILELGIPNTEIKTWKEASSFAAGLEQTFGVVILVTTMVGVIIVVSTVGIVVFINTSRKRRIIGVLKAIGMQKSQITAVFLAESFIFGLVGTLLGVTILFLALSYFASNPILLPIGKMIPTLSAGAATNSAVVLIVSSVVAGYIPARMASKHDILETIRVVE